MTPGGSTPDEGTDAAIPPEGERTDWSDATDGAPYDELGLPVGLDEAGKGLLDVAARTGGWADEGGTGEATGVVVGDAEDAHLRLAALARLADLWSLPFDPEALARLQGRPLPGLGALIAGAPPDPLPMPEFADAFDLEAAQEVTLATQALPIQRASLSQNEPTAPIVEDRDPDATPPAREERPALLVFALGALFILGVGLLLLASLHSR